VLPNLFSTTAHFLGTAHQTAQWAHYICGTYFIYKTYTWCIYVLYVYILCTLIHFKW